MLREQWITLWRGVTDARCLHTTEQLQQCEESWKFTTAGAAVKNHLTLVSSLHESRWRKSQQAGRRALSNDPASDSATGNPMTSYTPKWVQSGAVKHSGKKHTHSLRLTGALQHPSVQSSDSAQTVLLLCWQIWFQASACSTKQNPVWSRAGLCLHVSA